MSAIIQGAGVFFWLLLPCSVVALFVFFERLYALRRAAVLPEEAVAQVLAGKSLQGESPSVLARVARFADDPEHDASAVKAFARLEINRMERGFVFLEFIVGAAPMVGLMGTVTALIRVFGAIRPDSGVAAQAELTQGISLALSTTFLGLVIAVPSLFFIGYLQRRVETYAVQLEALIERMAARRSKS